MTDDDGVTRYACNDASFCEKRTADADLSKTHHLAADEVSWGPGTPDRLVSDEAGAGDGEAADGSVVDEGGDAE